ncbi:MAG TPA: NUDIX domain-containing protein [Anaerolineales bacterium]|nr:NUDIX domain-containing protein [Anaerolineales bacterium]
MRIRAGIVLIKENKVALMERYRAGFHYFIFPGGGVDEGETPEQAAVREAMEELGIEIAIRQKVAEIQVGQRSRQIYFLVEQIGGEFGTGTGEEFEDSNRDNPQKGIYIPTWMPVEDLPGHTNIYPEDVSNLVVKSMKEGWDWESIQTFEEPK